MIILYFSLVCEDDVLVSNDSSIVWLVFSIMLFGLVLIRLVIVLWVVLSIVVLCCVDG